MLRQPIFAVWVIIAVLNEINAYPKHLCQQHSKKPCIINDPGQDSNIMVAPPTNPLQQCGNSNETTSGSLQQCSNSNGGTSGSPQQCGKPDGTTSDPLRQCGNSNGTTCGPSQN